MGQDFAGKKARAVQRTGKMFVGHGVKVEENGPFSPPIGAQHGSEEVASLRRLNEAASAQTTSNQQLENFLFAAIVAESDYPQKMKQSLLHFLWITSEISKCRRF
ncbi:hypothetical protein [Abditibacterium utsteinense]|uniref:hypothetical protein n=1 Tax=Abditibacterium utsteinense TaxID=1960156 RepID=UPI0013002AA5|nr:hypothetical protein [Abditibacterium utsteinense]